LNVDAATYTVRPAGLNSSIGDSEAISNVLVTVLYLIKEAVIYVLLLRGGTGAKIRTGSIFSDQVAYNFGSAESES